MNYLVAVDDCFLDRPGGMGRVAWDIALAARDYGHQVTLVCCLHPRAASGTTVATEQGIRIVRTVRPDLPRWHPRRGDRTIAAVAQAVHETIASEPWDVVHIHTANTGAGAMAALGKKPRYIYTMHSPIVLEQQINWRTEGALGRFKMIFGLRRLKNLEGSLMRQSCSIHTLSEFSRSWVEHFHGLGNRVTVIPHWRRPDLERTQSKQEARNSIGWPEDEKILFTVRHHAPRYGLEVAIRAIAPLVAKGKCRFVVAGDGILRPALIELAQSLGLDDKITFPGRVTDKQLAECYQAADMFILPTRALECFGLISIEAMAFGCPIIGTSVGAIPEVLMPILPNCLVPPGDETALRVKVDEFLTGKLVVPSEAVASRLRSPALRTRNYCAQTDVAHRIAS